MQTKTEGKIRIRRRVLSFFKLFLLHYTFSSLPSLPSLSPSYVLTCKWPLDIKQRKTNLQSTTPEYLDNKEDPRRGIAGLLFVFSFMGNFHTICCNYCTNLYSHKQCPSYPFTSHLHIGFDYIFFITVTFKILCLQCLAQTHRN